MAYINGVSLSLVSLALLFACQSNAGLHKAYKDSPYCVKALDKTICAKIVKAADTWQEAITEALSDTIMQTKLAESTMANLLTTLPPTVDKKLKDNIEIGCRKAYKNVLETLRESKELLKTGDKTKSVNIKLSSAMSRLDDCKDEFKTMPMPHEFATFYEGSRKLLSTTLAVERTRPDLVN